MCESDRNAEAKFRRRWKMGTRTRTMARRRWRGGTTTMQNANRLRHSFGKRMQSINENAFSEIFCLRHISTWPKYEWIRWLPRWHFNMQPRKCQSRLCAENHKLLSLRMWENDKFARSTSWYVSHRSTLAQRRHRGMHRGKTRQPRCASAVHALISLILCNM